MWAGILDPSLRWDDANEATQSLVAPAQAGAQFPVTWVAITAFPAFARKSRWDDEETGSVKGIPEIVPAGVLRLDQAQLPRPVPGFELLLPLNRRAHLAVHFKPDKQGDAVAPHEV